MNTGRKIGPVEPRDAISGRPKSLEQLLRERNPIIVARKEGWEVGHFLGDTCLRKDGRCILAYADSGRFFSFDVCSDTDTSDRYKTTRVRSSLDQVKAALRGTLCSCGPVSALQYERRSHESSCPLSEVA